MRRHMITPAMTNHNDSRSAIVDAQERTSMRRFLAAVVVLVVLVVILAATWVWRFRVELGLG
jgi:hypothetical protein